MTAPQPAPERYSGRCSGRYDGGAAEPQVSGPAGARRPQDLFQVQAAGAQTTTTHEVAVLRRQLGDRDLAVLHTLAALRLMTTDQIRRIHFNTGSLHTQGLRARRSLQRLHTLGLVTRLARRVGGPAAGSASYTHQLTRLGHRVVGTRPTRPGAFGNYDHTLAVTELATSLYDANQAGDLELTHFEAEPTSWRTFQLDGTRRHVRPDAFLVVAAGEWERLWFIELDRGTQSAATIRRKAHAYRAYATTGQEQARWGVFPRVAYLTTTPGRDRALARALAPTPDADVLVTVVPLADAATALAPPTHTEGDPA